MEMAAVVLNNMLVHQIFNWVTSSKDMSSSHGAYSLVEQNRQQIYICVCLSIHIHLHI